MYIDIKKPPCSAKHYGQIELLKPEGLYICEHILYHYILGILKQAWKINNKISFQSVAFETIFVHSGK